MVLDRAAVLADANLTGRAWCRQYTGVVDTWLGELLVDATGGSVDGIALVAVGGYGRGELCPQSDIDVYLVHARDDAPAIADRVWYPVWDQDLHLGHSVCTVRQALRLATDDLDTATALLSARHIAGDERVTDALARQAAAQWERKSKRWLSELGARVALRHEQFGEVAFALEPDLKEGRGGLRDAHSLAWAQAAHRIMLDLDEAVVSAAYGALLDARVELQRRTASASNVLALQDQDDVAAALGDPSADVLMGKVAEAARTIAWTSDDTWRRVRAALRGPLGRVGRRDRPLDGQLVLSDGEVRVNDAAPTGDPVLVLRAAVAAAAHATVIERHTLERLAATGTPLPRPWPAPARDLFVQLLLCGRHAVGVIEALDQRGLWVHVLPEWAAVRSRPQRNPYHRFTVDRHLLECVANAARLGAVVARADLLVVAALLHDLGKGSVGDHTEAGTLLARDITARMGLDDADAATVVALVEHHLLLADAATRRDLDDPATVERVALLVGSEERLRLLAALTEADSMATGPSAWGPWKADLVGQLVERASVWLAGTPGAPPPPVTFPTPAQLERLASGADLIEAAGDVLTVMTADRPGVFSRIAGVLALHGLDVQAAFAHSTEDGRALSEFRVHSSRGPARWDRVTRDLRSALDGRLALAARVAQRAKTYERHDRSHHLRASTHVTFDVTASADATVVDVQAPDGIGVLYRITRALAELDVDIRSARAQTLGPTVLDAFYVRDRRGAKIIDADVLAEIEHAITHSLQAS
ncbi:MAG TPA: [protein-PII] uridylyltransferase [Acidimicrobiales bacterium]|nr:[protein-PII] uridylyltransferase [Acidimicrobiales bacterium]